MATDRRKSGRRGIPGWVLALVLGGLTVLLFLRHPEGGRWYYALGGFFGMLTVNAGLVAVIRIAFREREPTWRFAAFNKIFAISTLVLFVLAMVTLAVSVLDEWSIWDLGAANRMYVGTGLFIFVFAYMAETLFMELHFVVNRKLIGRPTDFK